MACHAAVKPSKQPVIIFIYNVIISQQQSAVSATTTSATCTSREMADDIFSILMII